MDSGVTRDEGVIHRQCLAVAAGEVNRADVVRGGVAKGSRAVTVKVFATPAVVVVGNPDTTNATAEAGVTTMPA